VKSNRSAEARCVLQRISELRKEVEHFIHYLDLLEARSRNFGKKCYSTEQVKKMLKLS
jgi:hypothetical protein